MAQWLRTLAALTEEQGSIPSIHMTDYNCLYLQLQGDTGTINTGKHQCMYNNFFLKKDHLRKLGLQAQVSQPFALN